VLFKIVVSTFLIAAALEGVALLWLTGSWRNAFEVGAVTTLLSAAINGFLRWRRDAKWRPDGRTKP
jgi:hypothetical protein